MKITVIAALAASCLIVSVAAQARDASVTVSYADLDARSPAGHAEAVKRIAKAAAGLCRDAPIEGVGSLAGHIQYEACVKATTDAAAVQLPPVTTVAQNGK